jgi:hypothetical protein
MALGRRAPNALSTGSPTVATHHRGIESGLVNEHESGWIQGRLRCLPSVALQAHLLVRVLGCYQRFF